MRKNIAHALFFTAALSAAASAPTYAQSTNSQTFDGWANDTATKYNGRVPRDVYLNEMGRRWDLDKTRQGTREAYLNDLQKRWDGYDSANKGMTPAEMSRLSGKVDSTTSTVPKTGSGAQPGNMGPGNSKGQ